MVYYSQFGWENGVITNADERKIELKRYSSINVYTAQIGAARFADTVTLTLSVRDLRGRANNAEEGESTGE